MALPTEVTTPLPVVAQDTEWAAGEAESDEENGTGGPEKHEAENYETRERRLTAGAEALGQEAILGDADVEVVPLVSEWSGEAGLHEDDSPRGALDQHAAEVYEARERRLTRGSEQLDKELMLGDTDVNVIPQTKEWSGAADTDLDDNPERDDRETHATEAYERREKRLTAGAEEIEKGLVLGDAEVEVVAESSEWAGDALAADEDRTDLDHHATEVYEQRERRLTAGIEELEKELLLGDADVPVTVEDNEWAVDNDAGDDDGPGGLDEHETEVYRRREKRLTRGAEELEKESVEVADAAVPVPAAAEDVEKSQVAPNEAAVEVADAAAPAPADAEDVEESQVAPNEAAVEVADAAEPAPAAAEDVEESRVAPNEAVVDSSASAAAAAATDDAPLAAASEAAALASRAAGETDAPGSEAGKADAPSLEVVASGAGYRESAAPAAAGEAGEESEWETEEESDDDVFNRANPETGLRRRDVVDPWQEMFHWFAAVVAWQLEAEGPAAKRVRTLVPGGLEAAGLTPECLCDGKILCAVIMSLRPEAVTKPIPNAMGRLAQVQKACKQLGVREADIFSPPDIMTPPPQNPAAVLRCMTALANLAQGWSDYSGPKLKRGKGR